MVASRWLIEGAYPASSSSFSSLAGGCSLAAVISATWTLFRKGPGRVRCALRDEFSWGAVGAAALLLSGTALSETIVGRRLNSNDATLALALCPVVVAVAASVLGDAGSADLTALLWPGLAGLTGLLLLLPLPVFGNWRPWTGLATMSIVTGVAAGVFSNWDRKHPSPAGGGLILPAGLALAAVMVGALAYARRLAGAPEPIALSAVLLDGVDALLTLVALKQLGAVRWSAQYLLIPLICLVEGIVFLRPFLDGRSWMGLGILALSTGYLLFAAPRQVGGDPGLSVVRRVPQA